MVNLLSSFSVCLPEGKSHSIPLNHHKKSLIHHFPMVFLWFSYGLPYPNYGCYCQMPWPWPSPRHVVNHDERSGGFYALGWAKGINEVVADASAVVCYENHRKTTGKWWFKDFLWWFNGI